ncbi:MAG: hypothetical protein HY297_01275 [Thaumarchaeota archaeon]|nr:hypothetical protein [Nitrososphaerota archaeon]
MHWAARIVTASVLELIVFNALAGGIALVLVLVFGGDIVPYYGLVMLLEAVILMLTGAALEMSTTGSARQMGKQLRILFGMRTPTTTGDAPDPRKVVMTAATYTTTGVLLFVEAGALSVVLY